MSYECKTLIENKCPVCGRNFVPAPYHIYKHGYKTLCSWSCYNILLREKKLKAEQRKQRRKKEKEAAQ